MSEENRTYAQNPKIDYLFGTFGGTFAPTKQDKYKPIEVFEIDETGMKKALKDFYIKRPGKNSIVVFEELIKNLASQLFSEKNSF